MAIYKTKNQIAPAVAAQWHPTKNGNRLASEFSAGSNVKAWWLCSCGYSWQTPIYSRKKYGCRQCSIRGKKNHNWKGYKELPQQYWYSIQYNAKTRGITFDLTIQEAWKLFLKQDRRCALTGRVLEMPGIKEGQRIGTASLDRINSNKGYTSDNIQWVHKDVQLMKNHFQNEYFISLCKEIAAR
jgi:hypothetical protein